MSENKVVFTERATQKIEEITKVIRISNMNHQEMVKISDRTSLPVYVVADRLISFALEHIHWEES